MIFDLTVTNESSLRKYSFNLRLLVKCYNSQTLLLIIVALLKPWPQLKITS